VLVKEGTRAAGGPQGWDEGAPRGGDRMQPRLGIEGVTVVGVAGGGRWWPGAHSREKSELQVRGVAFVVLVGFGLSENNSGGGLANLADRWFFAQAQF